MSPTTARVQARQSRISRPRGAGPCKTCTPCRQKKIKCDGTRPQCQECSTNGFNCVYAQDARREPRPSRARVENLEATVAVLLDHLRACGVDPSLKDWMPASSGDEGTSIRNDSEGYELDQTMGEGAGQLLTPSTSLYRDKEVPDGLVGSPIAIPEIDAGAMFQTAPSHPANDGSDTPAIAYPNQAAAMPAAPKETDKGESGMSPCEARVAGVFHEHGCVSAVHGLASILNPTSRAQHKKNLSTMGWKGEGAVASSKARLVSNAALQRQRERRLYRQPASLVDFDGCEPDLARHLLDLHFNRQHYAYMISYRPAIMESFVNGGGSWCNKLLLNAIYFSGTLYSDRQCLRSDISDSSSMSARFYQRFRQLLIEEIDKPSIPTAVALLLTSATLVSQGKSSSGWNLSGTAYRMIIDMGCHLMLGPDYESLSDLDHSQLLRWDLEQEMRKRLYWGAYVTDATQALYLGRPCMFATVEARVPLRFLDTFEELEEWEPYLDPHAVQQPPPYEPRPAHALSTFSRLARLFQISTRITSLYGIHTIKCTSEYLREQKLSIEAELHNWKRSLPDHLNFDPDTCPTPPPHQITPHTTYHALTILLQRAFLSEGHLRRHSTEESRKESEQTCIHSAVYIQKLVRAYRDAFTLRRAPFLLSYAVYSAVIVILRAERHDRGQFKAIIEFFWTCLSELQRGCNFGLEKPLTVLREVVREFRAGAHASREGATLDLDVESAFALPIDPALDSSSYTAMQLQAPQPPSPDYMLGLDASMALGTGSPGFCISLSQLESDLSHDALYGLFAPPQLFP
ncbi:fungal-specific transcription factor domain-containing protein [Aspergillus pseudoustus]|uniref:Fungal-specific transcription factor domain-containing protein n=1 Tax=Aspergillus pseudoustus TaxID=1810923 RepID=A0ABR4K9F2_9EURO